jgi:hypothetical protein
MICRRSTVSFWFWSLPIDCDKVKALRERLFGNWEMNWVGFKRADLPHRSAAHADQTLPHRRRPEALLVVVTSAVRRFQMFRSSIQNGENEQLRRIAQEIIVTQQQDRGDGRRRNARRDHARHRLVGR